VIRLVLLGFFVFAGCGRICPTGSEPVTNGDGGVAPCVQATDCPRASSVLVCSMTEDRLRNCVACEQGQCIRYGAEVCP
jgi:hypothetical protein